MSDPEISSAAPIEVPSDADTAVRFGRVPVLQPGNGPSEEARLARICELLSKAVVRDWASRIVVEEPRTGSPAAPLPSAGTTSDARRILDYLALVGEADAASIRETLGLSKMRVYRAISPLVAAGRVVAKGLSRQTCYSLSAAEAAKFARN